MRRCTSYSSATEVAWSATHDETSDTTGGSAVCHTTQVLALSNTEQPDEQLERYERRFFAIVWKRHAEWKLQTERRMGKSSARESVKEDGEWEFVTWIRREGEWR